MKRMIAMICAALVLSGCGGKEQTELSHAELLELGSIDIPGEYEHLSFSTAPRLELPKYVYDGELVQAEDYYEYEAEICRFFTGSSELEMHTSFAGTEDELRQCELPNGGTLNLNRNGEVGYIRDSSAFDYRDEASYERVVFLDMEYEDILIRQNGTDMELSELVSSVKGQLDTYTELTHGGEQIPKRAYIKSSRGSDTVLFYFSQGVYGTPLASFNTRCTGSIANAAEEWGTAVAVGSDGEIIFFSDIDGERRPAAQEGGLDSILTPRSAANALDGYLAPNTSYTVCSVSLELLPLISGNPRENDEGFQWTVSATNHGTVLTVEPYWSFVLLEEFSGRTYDAAVNAISGDIFFGREA